MIRKITRQAGLIVSTCVLACSFIQAQATNTGRVTGQVIREGSREPVPEVHITCRQNQPKGKSCIKGKWTGRDGKFELIQTPLGPLTVIANKRIPSENIILVGETNAYAVQETPKDTEPTPITLKKQDTTNAAAATRPNQTMIVMAGFQLTTPLNFGEQQYPDKPPGQSIPGKIAGKIVTADNKNPGAIKVVVESDETDEVLNELYVRLPDKLSDPAKTEFNITIDKTGDYRLAILAEGYYPANYLIIKQDPIVRGTGDARTIAIPLLVIKSDGERVSDPANIKVTLKPISQEQEEGLGQLINTADATRRNVF
jgi:hypothetical protein